MKKIIRIILLALALRLIVSFLGHHGDVNDFYWWTRELVEKGFAGFYDHNIANATQPIYPPVTSYLFWLSGLAHNAFWHAAWFLNVTFKVFPSNFIFWLESPPGWYVFNKLPAIFCDLGIIHVLYLFVKKIKDEKAGLLAAKIFAFLPIFWYNSSLWGQTESVFALPMLASFYLLYKRKIKSSMLVYTLALLTKPTAFFAFPIFVYWLFDRGKVKEILFGTLFSVFMILLLYFPFHPRGIIPWIISFYSGSLSGVLGYMVANAFNFWALFFGFDNRPDTSLFLGIPANVFGKIIFGLFTLLPIAIFVKRKINTQTVLLTAAILSFAAFMFLPRMHERYFYPVLVLMLPVAAIDKRIRNIFWFFSTIHLINLYHFWWVPKIPILVNLLSNIWIEKGLLVLNFGFFIYFIYIYLKYYARNYQI
jgi:Gpi18-like mannosyltransferase